MARNHAQQKFRKPTGPYGKKGEKYTKSQLMNPTK